MLVAQQQNGELLVLTKAIATDTLKTLRQQQTFFCPQCREPLLLKVGSIKIPHFAHHKHSACEQAFSEGETLSHILGKQQLFEFLQRLQLPVQLEYSLPYLAQRPDLFVELPRKRYAIEFQYSPIDAQIFHQRTNGYRTVQIEPIWLVQTPKSIVAPGLQRCAISHFHQLFMHQYKERSFICTYNPKLQLFSYITRLFHIHKTSYITIVDQLPIAAQSFPFFVPKAVTFERFCEAFQLYEVHIQNYLQYQFKYNHQGVQNLFLRYLYELRLGLMELPLFLYLPIKGNEYMHVICSGWQCALFYFARQLDKCIWELKMSEVQLFFTCMKLPYNVHTVEVLRRYARICRRLHITSHRSIVDRQQLLAQLYSQYMDS